MVLSPRLRAIADAARSTCPAGRDLDAIEHVVFLMQENRSFDHYFGTYPGVRGFDDHRPGHAGLFAQPDRGQRAVRPHGQVLPFHLDTASGGGCSSDISHSWVVQHRSWANGAMDGFVEAHLASDGAANAPMTMGYYERADLPFLYSLADGFTVLDGYHCSLLGPTWPNRIMSMTGTVDPDGKHGGPVIDNPTPSSANDVTNGMFDWPTMPEVLQDKGVSWKVYSQLATNNNVLSFFAGYTKPNSPLCQNALLPTWPGTFDADVAAGTLPQVSWVLAPTSFDEHPPPPMAWGEWVTSKVVSTLVSNPRLWAKTLLVITFDENGGYFDHVAPPAPPPGTPGEYLTVKQLPSVAEGIRGPVGLGVRVPTLLVSPFSRGGYVCSDVFDHTSMLKFLETRFDVHIPNISAWRRRTVGDLTPGLDVSRPNASVPALPAMEPVVATQTAACGPSGVTGTVLDNAGAGGNPGPVYPLPDPQRLPTQERGTAKRRSSC